MIWEFADVLGRRLVFWGVLSIAIGLGPALAGDPFWRGLGAMFVAWGAVDAALGAGARVLAERNRRASIGDVARRDRDGARLRAILLVNAGLDVLYVALGAWFIASAGSDAWRAGAGWGIVAQGGFLLLFDLVHARWVPAPGPLLPDGVELFAGPGHEGFRLIRVDDGGGPASAHRPEAVRGALLVHGFAGTPKEMRGLAAVLASSGWIVEVPRLPGHGPAIRDIADYRVEDWVRTVEEGAEALRASGVTQLIVAGHSVGGALALATCARVRPDALVLLAPFWWPVPWWQRLVAPVLRVFLPPGFRIFDRMDPHDPAVRASMEGFLPGMDLDDPAVLAGLRRLQVPLSALEQLFRVSALAGTAAPSVRVPVLAVQGTGDTVSRPERTRRLVALLPSPPSSLEVEAAHDLVTEASPARDQVLAAVLVFTTEVARPGPFEQVAAAHRHGPGDGQPEPGVST
ncbi:MAG TPA: alpha/beta fold hydrolase [Candidatus Limnocylindrales bacterium]|nr:alpha/beta fold hydrolase [Candidatus Limnocylindrales bacterium]